MLKNCDQEQGKMHIKIASIKAQINRIKTQLVQKVELGEMIQPIDFDELRIQKKDNSQNLEMKNKYLLELKRITGWF